MKIRLEGRLPYVTASLFYRGQELLLTEVILDTGSAASVFSADEVARIGLAPEPQDPIRRMLGIGGAEFVYSKRIEKLALGDLEATDFAIQVGAMDYGFPLQGLLGTDFLVQVGAVIDFGTLEVRSGRR